MSVQNVGAEGTLGGVPAGRGAARIDSETVLHPVVLSRFRSSSVLRSSAGAALLEAGSSGSVLVPPAPSDSSSRLPRLPRPLVEDLSSST